MGRHIPDKAKLIQVRGYQVFPLVASAIWIIILFGLLWADEESILLIKSILLIITGLSLYGLLWVRFNRNIAGSSVQ